MITYHSKYPEEIGQLCDKIFTVVGPERCMGGGQSVICDLDISEVLLDGRI